VCRLVDRAGRDPLRRRCPLQRRCLLRCDDLEVVDRVVGDRAGVGRARWVERAPVLLAYAGFVLVGLSAGVGGVLLPVQIRDYGVDKATIGIIFVTFSGGYLLAGAAAGEVIHRFGARAALAAGTGMFVLAGLAIAVRLPFAAFVAVQVLAGFGTGLLESVLNAYLSELPDAPVLLNRLHAFFGVGALLGPALATWILGAFAWPAVWLVLALAGVPLAAGYRLAYPRDTGSAGADPAPAGPGRGPSLGAALRQPAVLLAALFLAVYVGLEVSVGNWGFTFLTDEHRQPVVPAGYAVSGYWFGLTAGRFLISPVATRIGLTPIVTSFTCMVGVLISIALTWLAPGAWAADAGLLVLGFFLGPLFPTAMALMPRLTSARLLPVAIGVMNGVSVLGGALFPWLAGAAAQGIGVWTLMPFALALAGLQVAIWWRLTRRLHGPADRPRLQS
jgi:fucose permease